MFSHFTLYREPPGFTVIYLAMDDDTSTSLFQTDPDVKVGRDGAER